MITRMDTSEWIAHVDRLRMEDDLLSRGGWRGYTTAMGGEAPMRGHFYLVRWQQPTVAVSHDDPERVLELARLIESAMGDDDA